MAIWYYLAEILIKFFYIHTKGLTPAVGTFEVKSCLNVKKRGPCMWDWRKMMSQRNQEYQSFVLIGYTSGLSSLLEIAHFVIVLKKKNTH